VKLLVFLKLMLLTTVDVSGKSCFVCIQGLAHDLELKKYGGVVGFVFITLF